MALYQRIPTAQIEAVQFTERLANALRAHVLDGAPRPGDAPAALTYEEHAGYKFGVDRVAFGDYIVGGSSVVAGEAFEAQYEPVRAEQPETFTVRTAEGDVDVSLLDLAAAWRRERGSASAKVPESKPEAPAPAAAKSSKAKD